MTNHDPYAPFIPNVVEVDGPEVPEALLGAVYAEGQPESIEDPEVQTVGPDEDAEAVATEVETVEGVEAPPVDQKVSDVLDWVGADKNRARAALVAEQDARGDKARKSLVASLEELIN